MRKADNDHTGNSVVDASDCEGSDGDRCDFSHRMLKYSTLN